MQVVTAVEAPRDRGKKHKGRKLRGDPGVAEVSGLPKDITQVQHPVAICCPVGMGVLPATHLVLHVDPGVAAPRDAIEPAHVVLSSSFMPANASPVLLPGTTPSGPASADPAAGFQVTHGPFDKLVAWLRAKRRRRLHTGFWLWRAMALIGSSQALCGTTTGQRHPRC